MRKTIAKILFVAIFLCFQGQAGLSGLSPALAQQADQISDQTTGDGTPDSDYRLGPTDRVAITVYGEDEFSREYVVSPLGSISLPLIGEVKATGMTGGELRSEIERQLGSGFINRPSVTLVVTGFRDYFILGEVNKPGEYPYSAGLTIIQAVAAAEGFTYRAARRYVFLRHAGEKVETRLALTPDMKVRPGDTVRLGERYF